MGKLTLTDLKKVRDDNYKIITRREMDKPIVVTVGMGTCGISAGSKETFDAIVEALEAEKFFDAKVKQSACMGNCAVEPTVTVKVGDEAEVKYQKVTVDVAKQIVKEHIIGNKVVSDFVLENK